MENENCSTHGHKWGAFRCFNCFKLMPEYNDPIVWPLRDQFAMAAMQGMLAACNGPAWGINMFPLAESAYKYADAMLKARKENS